FGGPGSWVRDFLIREIVGTRSSEGWGACQILVYLFNDSFFRLLLVLQIIASLICLVSPFFLGGLSSFLGFYLVMFLFLVSLLTSVRWRGTVAGGADSMTLLILWTLSLALFGHSRTLSWAKLPILYLGVQICLSYFLAGLVKLGQASWRQGEAVEVILNRHALPWVKAAFRKSLLRNHQLLAWALISFELLFSFALLDRRVLLVACTLGFSFHILNFFVLGLNRFFWSWLASYPALWVLSEALPGWS
ncbi:MAG: hypothetical protein WCH11_06725, partial [Bdellovibrio sp.]